MSNVWIILCVLCWYPQTVSPTVHIVEQKTDWFTASQTCNMQQGRLPGGNVYDHRLKLKDFSDTKNISSPFWIAATYEIMNYNHCELHYAPNEIYQEADWKYECKDWPSAFQVCTSMKLNLTTRENSPFLERVANSVKPFWLDDMPQRNLAPDIRMQNRTCLYSFNGIIHEGNCSDTSITTVCILDLVPDTFCQTIDIYSGKKTVEWRPCWECNNFSCAISHNEIYQEADWKYECKDWHGAFQECNAMRLSLASRENAEFLNSVRNSAKPFWLDDMPQNNIPPDIRMKNRTCLYSLNGIIHEGNCSNSSITTVCILVHIVEQKADWFTASQTCTRQQGRLSSVNSYDHRLKLKDLSDTKNISSPFWIAATYDILNYNHCEQHYDLCPDTFCQTIAMSSGKINVEWRPCWECNNFSCAFSPSEIYQEADWKYECKEWSGAIEYCKERNLSLATRENAPFLERVTHSVKTFWLDDIPQSNLVPDIRMQNRTCLYSFNGIIHEGNCSDTSITIVCILV